MSISISQLALLVDIDISCMTGSKTDKNTSEFVSENLAQTSDTNQCGRYVKNVFGDCKDLRDIRNHAQSIRTRLKNLSLPYPLGDFRMVPNDRLGEFMNEFDVANQKMNELVDRFVNNYDSNIDHARSVQGGLFNPADIPDVSVIKNYFKCKVNVQPIPNRNSFDQLLGLNDAVEYLKEEIELRNKNAIDNAKEHLRDRIKAVVKHAVDRLESYAGSQDRYYKSWLNNVSETAQICMSLNVLSDSVLESVCENLISVCSVNHDTLKNDIPSIYATCNILRSELTRL